MANLTSVLVIPCTINEKKSNKIENKKKAEADSFLALISNLPSVVVFSGAGNRKARLKRWKNSE